VAVYNRTSSMITFDPVLLSPAVSALHCHSVCMMTIMATNTACVFSAPMGITIHRFFPGGREEGQFWPCLHLGCDLPVPGVQVQRDFVKAIGPNVGHGVITPWDQEREWPRNLVEASIGDAQAPLILVPWDVLLVWLRRQHHLCSPRAVVVLNQTVVF